MIKPITTSPFVKRAVVGAMMAGAVATGTNAANSRSNSASEQPMYTEISSAASSAVSAAAMSQVFYNNDDGRRNESVGRRMTDLLGSTTMSELVQENVYRKVGLYGASLELQAQCTEIGLFNIVYDCLQKNSYNLSSYEKSQLNDLKSSVTDGAYFNGRRKLYDEVTGIMCENYKNPTANEALDGLDEIAGMLFANNKDLYNEYTTAWKDFDSQQNGSTTSKQKANLISFKVFWLDCTLAKGQINKRDLNSRLGASFREYMRDYAPKPIR